MTSMMERWGNTEWLRSCDTYDPMLSQMDGPEDVVYPLGPGENELRWSLMRVRCWDCREEAGAWLKECDADINAQVALERASWHDDAEELYSDETSEERLLANRTDNDDGFNGDECTKAVSDFSKNNAGKSTNLKRPSNTMLLSPFVISSGLLSPPVDGGPLNGVEENGGFYMLKKDSQRRQTIVKVMQEDKEQLLSIWMGRIRATLPAASTLLIREEHLNQLLGGIIAYLPAQDKNPLSKVLSHLKESLDYDGQAVNQLQIAFFVFQQSVMDILQARQNIKPHWMFALDNLVKQCCQAAVSILSPELAANISGHNIEEEGEDDRISTTSGVSTSNSIRSAAHRTGEDSPAVHLSSNLPENSDFFKYFKILGTEHEKTASLVSTLVQNERLYQDVLETILQSRRHQQRFVQDVASNGTESGKMSQVSPASQQSTLGPSAVSRPRILKEDGDSAMVKWLEDIGLDEESVLKFVQERFTMEDILQLVDRDDLKRLGLKLGYEVRVWTQIQRHRNRKDAPAMDSVPNNP